MALTCQVTESLVVFATVAVKVCVPLPACTLLLAGHTARRIPGVVVVHDFAVALLGAVEVADVGLKTTSAVSGLPPSSVTTRCTVAYPHDGAVTVAVEAA